MQTDTVTAADLIAAHPFFEGINPAFGSMLNGVAMFATYDVNDTILNEGADAERFHLIRSGTVALEAYLPGKGSVTVQILGAGEALGFSWLYPPYRWRFTARPIHRTEVVSLDARALREYGNKNPEFGRELAMRVGQIAVQRLQAAWALLVDYHGITE
jgi:CRP/FNR family cyclic AMP-dependent transcriptional regulator